LGIFGEKRVAKKEPRRKEDFKEETTLQRRKSRSFLQDAKHPGDNQGIRRDGRGVSSKELFIG